MRKIEIDTKSLHEIKPRVPAGFPFSCNRIRISQYENKHFTHHWHRELEFTVIESNGMFYQANDRIFALREGDGMFVNSNVLHSAWLNGEGDCSYYPINIDLSLLLDYEGSDIHQKYILPIFETADFPYLYLDRDNEKHAKILSLLRDCVALRSEKKEYYELLVKAKIFELWALLCEEAKHNRIPLDKAAIPSHRINDIKVALSFMRQNYREHITLDDIIRACGMSKSEFSRCFKALTHLTPIEYLLQYRIQRSLNLLVRPDSRITEVAAECGFSGPSYYAEIFRRTIGCSPLEYKKMHARITVEKQKNTDKL